MRWLAQRGGSSVRRIFHNGERATMMTTPDSKVVIRRATADDAATCGKICYDAFDRLTTKHGFPCDFPNADDAVGTLAMMFAHPKFFCVVAESGGGGGG